MVLSQFVLTKRRVAEEADGAEMNPSKAFEWMALDEARYCPQYQDPGAVAQAADQQTIIPRFPLPTVSRP